jgi:2-polyprenyl-6-hydroxyphenyl methylase/3-demethylubiquinone-9 3-methyltransferase
MTHPPRTRYPADHWARRAATSEHLDDYLRRADTYNLTKVRMFERLLGPDLTGRRVLDYGGGAGFMAVRCAELGARVTLVDAEPTALDTAMLLASRRGVERRIVTVCSEEFPRALLDEQFDIVLLKDVVEHIPDDEALLRGLARCQDRGGRLLLSTQSSWSLNFLLEGTYRRWWRGEREWFGWDPTHVRFYSPRSLGRLLRGAGNETTRWSALYIVPYNIVSWLLLGMRQVELDTLHHVDLWLGHRFPFNRLGWNVVVECIRSPAGVQARSNEVKA